MESTQMQETLLERIAEIRVLIERALNKNESTQAELNAHKEATALEFQKVRDEHAKSIELVNKEMERRRMGAKDWLTAVFTLVAIILSCVGLITHGR